jgi:uncharacterized protein YihD (DUF1040 family)
MKKEQKEILKQIDSAWKKNPSLRFCQLLQFLNVNQTFMIDNKMTAVRDNFHDTDGWILNRMRNVNKKR